MHYDCIGECKLANVIILLYPCKRSLNYLPFSSYRSVDPKGVNIRLLSRVHVDLFISHCRWLVSNDFDNVYVHSRNAGQIGGDVNRNQSGSGGRPPGNGTPLVVQAVHPHGGPVFTIGDWIRSNYLTADRLFLNYFHSDPVKLPAISVIFWMALRHRSLGLICKHGYVPLLPR